MTLSRLELGGKDESASTMTLVPAAFIGGLVAILFAHVRFRVPPRDEHLSDAQRDLVDVSLAEMVGAQVAPLQKLGRRQFPNANFQQRCIKFMSRPVTVGTFL